MSAPEGELQSKLQTLHDSLETKLVRDPKPARQAVDAVAELLAQVEANEISLEPNSNLLDAINRRLAILDQEINETVWQITFPIEDPLTPHVLDTVIVPYLNAVERIQRIIADIDKRQSSYSLTIRSIKQESPVNVTLNGVSEAIQFIKDLMFRWRREHDKKMAQLTEQDREVEIEKKRLENQKIRMELRRLTLEQIDQLFPHLSKTAKIRYVRKLLPELEIVIPNYVEIRMLDDFETRSESSTTSNSLSVEESNQGAPHQTTRAAPESRSTVD